MDAGETTAAQPEQAAMSRQTVVALFEDTIDAERALVALRKADHDAERVSLLVRDKNAEEESGADRAGAVARAVVATALDAVGGWLQGLASLIVPERGTFLVAGPLGAALAGKRDGSSETVIAATAVATTATDLGGGLLRTLGDFGFSAEEATYLEHRLAAGVALVAVTANDEAASQATRRLFADHDAVYIGTARTDSRLLAEAEALLGAPPEVSDSGDVVVTDAVARLRRVGEQGGSARSKALCERPVVDEAGEELGRIEEVLVEVESVDATGPTGPGPEREVVRYVVVGFGGLLGLGRHHVAVPAPLLDLDAHPIRLRSDKKVLQRAPAYDENAPFSRREERAVSAYFGTPPYWQEA